MSGILKFLQQLMVLPQILRVDLANLEHHTKGQAHTAAKSLWKEVKAVTGRNASSLLGRSSTIESLEIQLEIGSQTRQGWVSGISLTSALPDVKTLSLCPSSMCSTGAFGQYLPIIGTHAVRIRSPARQEYSKQRKSMPCQVCCFSPFTQRGRCTVQTGILLFGPVKGGSLPSKANWIL